jgi:hypothetical protein
MEPPMSLNPATMNGHETPDLAPPASAGPEVVIDGTAAAALAKRRAQNQPAGVRLRTEDLEAHAVEQCSNCGTPIALQPPTPSQPACTWLCKTCGLIYFGGDDESAAARSIGLIKAKDGECNPFVAEVKVSVDARHGCVPPENVQRIIRALTQNHYHGAERRKGKHYAVAVPVVAVPLGADFGIIGEPVQMTTINVSQTGAALLHTRFTQAPYYALDFTLAGVELVQVVLEVLRVRNVGVLYEVAGRFVSRLTPKAPSAASAPPA